jgi:uncharacterized protein YggE
METEVIVMGRAEARSLPDRAVIHCTIDAEGSSRESAYSDAAESAKQVDEVLATHREAFGRVTTAALVVHPKTRWRKGESVRTGWLARRLTTVEVTGFEHLGELIAELAAGGASIAGPTWQVDPINPVHSEARQSAARDARQRAADYASALGVEIGDIAWISEPGLRLSVDSGPPTRAFAAARGGAPDGALAEETIEVTPEEITVDARVEVAFRFGPSGTRPAP